MPVTRILWWLFWVFLAWWVITDPSSAAAAAKGLAHLGDRAALAVSTLIGNL